MNSAICSIRLPGVLWERFGDVVQYEENPKLRNRSAVLRRLMEGYVRDAIDLRIAYLTEQLAAYDELGQENEGQMSKKTERELQAQLENIQARLDFERALNAFDEKRERQAVRLHDQMGRAAQELRNPSQPKGPVWPTQEPKFWESQIGEAPKNGQVSGRVNPEQDLSHLMGPRYAGVLPPPEPVPEPDLEHMTPAEFAEYRTRAQMGNPNGQTRRPGYTKAINGGVFGEEDTPQNRARWVHEAMKAGRYSQSSIMIG